VEGFQLSNLDIPAIVPREVECSSLASGALSVATFTMSEQKNTSEAFDRLYLYNVSSTATGFFRLCLKYGSFDDEGFVEVGIVSVRAACSHPKVLVDGACVVSCPPSRVPVAGECIPDLEAKRPLERFGLQSQLVSFRMRHSTALENRLFEKEESDPDRRYFVYRLGYELARVLDAAATRFAVATLTDATVTKGDTIVAEDAALMANVIFKPEVSEALGMAAELHIDEATGRSSPGLLRLFRSLQQDEDSLMWDSPMFAELDKTFVQEPVTVRYCESISGTVRYRSVCPYFHLVASTVGTIMIYFVSTSACFIVVLVFVAQLWRLEFDDRRESDGFGKKLHRVNPYTLSPSAKSEHARSWLEHRWVEDEATVRRRSRKDRSMLSGGSGRLKALLSIGGGPAPPDSPSKVFMALSQN